MSIFTKQSIKNKKRGLLFAIGGALDLSRKSEVLKRFLNECGGTNAAIVYMPSYIDNQEKIALTQCSMEKAFNEFGVTKYTYCYPKNGIFRDEKNYLRALETCTGVFFCGGSQRELFKMLHGTQFLKIVKERFALAEINIAGTSAGCAILSEIMILGGLADPETGKGFGFRKDIIFDQHFSSGNANHRVPRFRRLLAANYDHSDFLGLGVDENTCLLLNGSTGTLAEIIGEGTVTLIDASQATAKVYTEDKFDPRLAGSNVRVKTLEVGTKCLLKVGKIRY